MHALVIVGGAVFCVAAYAAFIRLLGACLNLHGEPPRNHTKNGSK